VEGIRVGEALGSSWAPALLWWDFLGTFGYWASVVVVAPIFARKAMVSLWKGEGGEDQDLILHV
jgi:hypothetical protein